jgi:hypothetical protein
MQEVKLYLRDGDLGPVDPDNGQDSHYRWEATVAGYDAAGATPADALKSLAAQVAAALDGQPEPAAAATTSSSDF